MARNRHTARLLLLWVLAGTSARAQTPAASSGVTQPGAAAAPSPAAPPNPPSAPNAPSPSPSPAATDAPAASAPPVAGVAGGAPAAAPPASGYVAPTFAPPAPVATSPTTGGGPAGHATAAPPTADSTGQRSVDAAPTTNERAARTVAALELGAGLAAGGRLPRSATDGGRGGRSVDEVVDSALGLGVWAGSRSAVYGLVVERLGLGKDLYGTSANGETLNVAYLVDTLWLSGRWYLADDRPAMYLSLAAGPALPRARATGTRATTDVLVTPPESYQCSSSGRVGAGIAAAAGGEFDVSESWSVVGEARVSGHFLTRATDAFSGCAPGPGPAIGGALRLGVAYRFGR